jgi:hypothetical protein
MLSGKALVLADPTYPSEEAVIQASAPVAGGAGFLAGRRGTDGEGVPAAAQDARRGEHDRRAPDPAGRDRGPGATHAAPEGAQRAAPSETARPLPRRRRVGRPTGGRPEALHVPAHRRARMGRRREPGEDRDRAGLVRLRRLPGVLHAGRRGRARPGRGSRGALRVRDGARQGARGGRRRVHGLRLPQRWRAQRRGEPLERGGPGGGRDDEVALRRLLEREDARGVAARGEARDPARLDLARTRQKQGDVGRRDQGNPCDWAPFVHIGLPR